MTTLANHHLADPDVPWSHPTTMKRLVLPFLFALTMFTSAGLLFCVQPMIAKMILPLLGGSPMVWNTCMVFFQALLLLGYVWAHFVAGWPRSRWQAAVQIGLVMTPLMLPTIGITSRQVEAVPRAGNPIPWLIGVLIVSVGLPFFVLSTTAPRLHKCFAVLCASESKDPYYLYGSS